MGKIGSISHRSKACIDNNVLIRGHITKMILIENITGFSYRNLVNTPRRKRATLYAPDIISKRVFGCHFYVDMNQCNKVKLLGTTTKIN